MRFARLCWAALALCAPGAARAAIWYVNASATGTPHDGRSWSQAFLTVQAAINAAAANDEVWVAKATYPENLTTKDGLALYGGFAGTETAVSQRDWAANPTILDGNHAGSVVTVPAYASGSTVVDGFTVQNGKGTAPSGYYLYGGGFYLNDHASPTIRNNTIRNNTAGGSSQSDVGYGAGIYCGDLGQPLIEDNTFTGNSALYAGAIYLGRASATIRRNAFTGNSALAAAGALSIGAYSKADIRLNQFVTNTAQSNGGAIYCDQNSQPTIAANLFKGNTAPLGSGGAIYCTMAGISSSPCRIYSNVLDGNQAPIGAGAYCDGYVLVVSNTILNGHKSGSYGSGDGLYFYSLYQVYNNIVKGNDTGIGFSSTLSDGAARFHCNCIYGNTVDLGTGVPSIIGSNGNISADPLLVNPASGDYSLPAVSPCVDAGENTYPQDIDYLGNPRVFVSIDIGAVEFQPTLVWTTQPGRTSKGQTLVGPPTITLKDAQGNTYSQTGLAISLTLLSPPGVSGASLSGTTSTTFTSGVAAFPNLSINRAAVGYQLHPSITGANSGAFSVTIPRIYVTPTGNDANEGDSWSNARSTVDNAVQGTDLPGEVWVKQGSYSGGITLPAGVKLLGGFTGEETSASQRTPWTHDTILEGGGAVVAINGGSTGDTVLDGFVITRGTGVRFLTVPTGVYYCGGGVYVHNASPTITHNTITNNSATLGGGIYLYGGAPLVQYNRVTGNSVRSTTKAFGGGGGIAATAGCTGSILDNLIAQNTSDRPTTLCADAYGGGMGCLSSSPEIRNNTIVDNEAFSEAGGVYLYASSPAFINNIIARNNGGVFSTQAGSPAFQYNGFYGNTGYNVSGVTNPIGSNGNIIANPLFANPSSGDYHLSAGSSLIDRGLNSAVAPREYDLDNHRRVLGGTVDMGAYEFVPFMVSDAASALRNAGGMEVADLSEMARLNIASDPGITVLDAVQIVRRAMGLDANP